MLSFSNSSSSKEEKSSTATNLNIHGDSPPPKEVPDMSSATFVSVGGDKLTLALGSSTNSSTSPPDTTTSGSSSSDKLINLDSPTNKVTPPVPPPRTTSDPNYPNYQN